MKKCSFSILIFCVTVGILFTASPASAQEQRCTELNAEPGANCGCSEPLNTTSYTSDGWYLNPSDSPPATDCDGEIGGGYTWWKGYQTPLPVSETNMPFGNTVDTVWRSSGGGGAYLFGSRSLTSSTKRLCTRHYFKVSSDFTGTGWGGCNNNKLSQFVGSLLSGDGSTTDLSIHYAAYKQSYSAVPGGLNLPKSGDHVTWDDCRENWCRFEICQSGNLATGTDLYAEGYIQQVTGGSKRMDYERSFLGNGPTPITDDYGSLWIMNMYREGACAGNREFSHAMQAEWDTDAGQFIGAACEVEGGCGPVCGNGVIESGEGCDDDDASSGDGCSSSCQVESGWTCSGVPSFCSPLGGMERRCAELGDNCRCSEPLNTDTFTRANPGTPTEYFLNPTDSTTKACNSPDTLWSDRRWYPQPESSLTSDGWGDRLPPGNTVTYVGAADGSGAKRMDGEVALSSTRRMCFRHYVMFHSDNTPMPNYCNNKLMEIGIGSQSQLILSQLAGTTTLHIWGALFQYLDESLGNANNYGTGTLDYDDCCGKWCIAEMCVSGNIEQGTDLTLEGYMRNIITGEERTWDHYLGYSRSGGGAYAYQWIVNAYNQGNPPSTPCVNPARLISHGMQAEWDTDAGQWIGPACEVEGDCGPVIPGCGNSIIETEIGEVCDGTNFGGQACSDYGFTGGTLLCTTNCTVISTSNCNNLSDTTPPTLAITSPSDGATVSGMVTIQASATDASGIQSVTFQVDGSTFATDTTSPYQAIGDSTLVPDGPHTITVIARDSSPNQNEATETITIIVNNLGPPPEPVCGNGVIETGEGCDDDNTANGDGCSSSCQVESGWICYGAPSSCSPVSGGDIPGGGQVLFYEPFEDSDFTSRGWYDDSNGRIIPGGYNGSAFECHFSQGSTVCVDGRPSRRKFSETETAYLSFYVKFDPNYIGSGKPYHPHMFNFLSNLDGDYVGPSNTYLNAYAEISEYKPKIHIQDSMNVDDNCVKRFETSEVFGCEPWGFDDYPFTEERSVASCNGLVGEVDEYNCYDNGGYWYSARGWDNETEAYGDGSPPFDKVSWHHVEVYYEMNSIVDGIGIPDGKIRWIHDGITLISSDNILFRTGEHPTLTFNQFNMMPYIGDGSPIDQSLYVDELVVATARPGQSCNTNADQDCNGCVDSGEINIYIDAWYADSTAVTMVQLIRALEQWKEGGC
jgi:cysteine-rich repeat protein